MSDKGVENIDVKCAKVGREIVEESTQYAAKTSDIKNSIQKLLGILQEDGIYAFTVYLDSEDGFNNRKIENVVLKRSLGLLQGYSEIEFINKRNGDLKNENQVYAKLEDFLSEDIDKIFFAKDMIEKTLIYARYHAKALNELDKEEE